MAYNKQLVPTPETARHVSCRFLGRRGTAARYQAIAEGLNHAISVRAQDVFISLVEVKKKTGRLETASPNMPPSPSFKSFCAFTGTGRRGVQSLNLRKRGRENPIRLFISVIVAVRVNVYRPL